MNTKKQITGIEIITGTALFIFIAYGMYLRYFAGSEAFLSYTREDGIVEYATVLFLFLSCLVCIFRVIQYIKIKKPLWVITWALLAFLFFFAAGDEISWGQRIFGIESGEFFKQHNKQAETNIHNLVVGGQSLNILIFSRLMFVVLVIYFLFSHLMVLKIPFIRNLVIKFQIPLPKMHQIIMMVAVTIMILLIQTSRDSELNELSFAMVFFLILLNPALIQKE